MQDRIWLRFLLVAAVTATGCYKDNPLYCAGHPGDPTCPDGIPAMSCTSNAQCMAPTAVCDGTGTRTCVQCTTSEPAACAGVTPVCGPDHTCQGCTAHTQCGSNACLPDGSCGDDGQVAYVANPGGTDNASCTKAMPCTKLQKALDMGRPYVKLTGATDEGGTVVIDSRDITLLADPGAKLVRTSNGIVLEVKGTSQVAIYDLEISGGSGPQGVGISLPTGNTASLSLTRANAENNTGGGISSTGGAVTVTQSTIAGNTGGGISSTGGSLTVTRSTISGNQGGGISAMNGTFVIVGNVFFGNGSGTATTGGIHVLTSQSAANRLDFNTLSRNLVADTLASGIQCTAGSFTASNNIVYDNGTGTNLVQVAGSCQHAFSDIGPMGVAGGTGNLDTSPMFLDEANGDLHVGGASPVRGLADPGANLTDLAAQDIDGDRRGRPADIGADEVP